MATVMVPAPTEQSKAIVVPSGDTTQSHHQRTGAGRWIGAKSFGAATAFDETGAAEAMPGATSAAPPTIANDTSAALTAFVNVSRTAIGNSFYRRLTDAQETVRSN